MDVIEVNAKIPCVSDHVIIKALLPRESAHRFLPEAPRHVAFDGGRDLTDISFRIWRNQPVKVIWQDHVAMVTKGMERFDGPHGFEEKLRLAGVGQPWVTVPCDHGNENRYARSDMASVSRHVIASNMT